MSKRDKLLKSIAKTTKDYRSNELHPPTSGHVDQWVRQFDKAVQDSILCEAFRSARCVQTFMSTNALWEIQSLKLLALDP